MAEIILAGILGLIIWAIIVIDCRVIAGQLNRDKDTWTILAIFAPILVLLILGLILKPKKIKTYAPPLP